MPFIDTSELRVREPLPGWKGRFFHSENMTFAHYTIDAGSSIHEHHHPNEEVWIVLEGEMEFSIGGVTRMVGPGAVAVVPSDTPHSVKALTSGRAIVANHPVRREFG